MHSRSLLVCLWCAACIEAVITFNLHSHRKAAAHPMCVGSGRPGQTAAAAGSFLPAYVAHLQRATTPLTSSLQGTGFSNLGRRIWPGPDLGDDTSTVWVHHALLLFIIPTLCLPPDVHRRDTACARFVRFIPQQGGKKNATSASVRNSFSLSGPRGNSGTGKYSQARHTQRAAKMEKTTWLVS